MQANVTARAGRNVIESGIKYDRVLLFSWDSNQQHQTPLLVAPNAHGKTMFLFGQGALRMIVKAGFQERFKTQYPSFDEAFEAYTDPAAAVVTGRIDYLFR